MAQGLISNFDRWKPGESQGLIDPSWSGGQMRYGRWQRAPESWADIDLEE